MDNIKLIIDIFTAILSPLIAITVAYIAYQQWKLNASKETREVRSEKLRIYLTVKRFLNNVDETRKVDLNLYKELQEVNALADFIFDTDVTDWLSDIEIDASTWLDTDHRLSLDQVNLSLDIIKREEKILNTTINRLQNAHYNLLDMFKDKIIV